jgi:hypothetical protein
LRSTREVSISGLVDFVFTSFMRADTSGVGLRIVAMASRSRGD